ncbi:MAG: hypothetical protein LBK03_04285 [Bacteroidales bacterium]|jgi:hypothetical protein|nr:hypothetical protein [Bacteroidales bacterium]
MKKLKLALILAAIILLSGGCKKEIVTYRFTEEDKLKLLPHYIEGKIFTFVNENGETRKFKIGEIKQDFRREFDFGGLGGYNQSYFFHEYKRIKLLDLKTNNTFLIQIWKYPIEINIAKENIYKEYSAHLIGKITSDLPYYFTIEFNYDNSKEIMNINEVIYNNVLSIETNCDFPNEGGMLIDAVKIYFDEYQGLIGFDDYYGKQWRLENK